jgi:hypothetical protein
MKPASPPRGALRRLLGKLLFAGIGVAAAPAAASEVADGDAEADTDEVVTDVVDAALDLAGDPPDPVAGGHMLAILLEGMHPLDAIRTAATAALSPRVEVRRSLAEALSWVFPLATDGVILEHLARDPEVDVRIGAARAAHARRASAGEAVLHLLEADPSSRVADAARLALHGR